MIKLRPCSWLSSRFRYKETHRINPLIPLHYSGSRYRTIRFRIRMINHWYRSFVDGTNPPVIKKSESFRRLTGLSCTFSLRHRRNKKIAGGKVHAFHSTKGTYYLTICDKQSQFSVADGFDPDDFYDVVETLFTVIVSPVIRRIKRNRRRK